MSSENIYRPKGEEKEQKAATPKAETASKKDKIKKSN
jgi:hypothetical protein